MAKRKKRRRQEEHRPETRKQQRIRARDRERNRRLVLGVGSAVAVALLLVVVGLVNELWIKPNRALAQVADRSIITRDYVKRLRLEKALLEEQLLQLQLFEQQLGNQGFFTNQIIQVQSLLADPLTLGTQVLNTLIEEQVIRIRAAEMGIAVTDAEVEEALREEVAALQGALTVPQATATAQAAVEATATAALFTPTPTLAAEEILTPTLEPPTPTPRPLLDDALYQEGLRQLEQRIQEEAGITLAEYREIVRARLLRQKLRDRIGEERVSPTEEQIRVRHILVRVDETAEPESTEPVTATLGLTETLELTATQALTATETVTATQALTDTVAPVEEPGRTDAEALALALEIRQRLLDGEDFAELARQYSDDPGSADQGGDLGWVGRGRFVPEFEEVAFQLEVGAISEPVRTSFGYHIIQVLEKDPERPKDPGQLEQEKDQAFQEWLQEQVQSVEIRRPDDLLSVIPDDL